MSAEARQARQKNFSMPTAEEIREIQKLEAEREQRRSMRLNERMQRGNVIAQRWSLAVAVLSQVPRDVDENRDLHKKAREYVHLALDEALATFHAKDDEEPEPTLNGQVEQEEPALTA